VRCVPLTLLVLTGCAEGPPEGFAVGRGSGYARLGLIEDRWSVAMAACGDPAPWEVQDPAYREGFRSDTVCQQALEDDLGMTLESMGGSELFLSVFRTSMLELMGAELGVLDELEVLPPGVSTTARPALLDTLQAIGDATGRPETQAALYNLVASLVTRVEKVDTINDGTATGSEIEWDTGRMYTTGSCAPGNWSCATTLVHEATHVWNQVRHVECPEGTEVHGIDVTGRNLCDANWNSARGFEGGAAALLDHHLPAGGEYENGYREDAASIIDEVHALVLED
jgi:hypothetical protein